LCSAGYLCKAHTRYVCAAAFSAGAIRAIAEPPGEPPSLCEYHYSALSCYHSGAARIRNAAPGRHKSIREFPRSAKGDS
jgi:hypothetical protein